MIDEERDRKIIFKQYLENVRNGKSRLDDTHMSLGSLGGGCEGGGRSLGGGMWFMQEGWLCKGYLREWDCCIIRSTIQIEDIFHNLSIPFKSSHPTLDSKEEI